MVLSRGLTFLTLERVTQALEQLLADAERPTSITARILDEHAVTADDVMRVMRVARDALWDVRGRNSVDNEEPAFAPASQSNVPTLDELRDE